MGDASIRQGGGDGQLSGLDHVVGGGEHCVHLARHGADGGDDLVRGVPCLFQIADSLAVQVRLGVLDGGSAVHLRGGVEQAHRLDVGVLGQHHIQQQLHVQCVAGPGDIGDAGELGYLRIADGAVHHRGLGGLRRGYHLLGGGGADGDDDVIAVGDDLGADLGQGGGVVVAVKVLVVDGHVQLRLPGVQLGDDGVPDLIHGCVVQLPHDGYLIDAVGRGGGAGAGTVGSSAAGAAGAGGQGQGQGQGERRGQKLLHGVVFHYNDLHIARFRAEIGSGGRWRGRCQRPVPEYKKTAPYPIHGTRAALLRYHPN